MASTPPDFDRLFILEMANNHMGDVNHGLKIIRDFHAALKDLPFQFAFKFQYRYLDSFVHPQYKDRTDIKLIKRFTETLLSEDDYKRLRDEVKACGWLSVCTPFDEKSVALVVKHQHDVIKIPSCYFADWPYLEAVVQTDLPIIASTAGASLTDVDRVVSFLQHRNKNFAIMHCVAEYPTADQDLQLNQIEILRGRYARVPIGFSTHESPSNLDSIKVAVAKGARLFEKHVGVATDKYSLNAYSADPQQARQWVLAAQKAYEMCGVTGPKPVSAKEAADLRALYRGVFAKEKILKGQTLNSSNVFLAMPCQDGQIIGQEFSKYTEYTAQTDIEPLAPVYHKDTKVVQLRDWVEKTIHQVKGILKAGNISLPNKVEVELSHHKGVENFQQVGGVIINIINREYCKKILIMLPGQSYPTHSHKVKDETLHILYGSVTVELEGGKTLELKAGDLFPVERGTSHAFKTTEGVAIEEISTTYVKGDSYYEAEIYENPKRKTLLTFWSDWMKS